MKHYKGKQPSLNDGWILDKTFKDSIDWFLHIKPQAHSKEWVTCKLSANGKSLNKANYWFAFNVENKQFGFCRDLMLMQKHQPNLYQMVTEEFKGESCNT